MNKKGFTVTELLVTISILGILSAISIPAFSSWLPNYRLKKSVRDIYDAMNLAKLSAVKANNVAVVKFSITDDTYMVFLDTDSDWVRDSTETIIGEGTMGDNIDITSDSTFPTISSQPQTYGFSSRGMSQTPCTGPYNVYLKSSNGRYMGVRVNAAGSLKIIQSTDGGSTWS